MTGRRFSDYRFRGVVARVLHHDNDHVDKNPRPKSSAARPESPTAVATNDRVRMTSHTTHPLRDGSGYSLVLLCGLACGAEAVFLSPTSFRVLKPYKSGLHLELMDAKFLEPKGVQCQGDLG